MAYEHRRNRPGRTFVARIGAVIVVCTAALTLSFIGIYAFVTGQAGDVINRVPFYSLGMAVVFVTMVIALEQRHRKSPRASRDTLVVAMTTAIVTFVFITLGGEGFVYAARRPDQALAAQRFLYLVAAGLISTGIGYWAVENRRQVIQSLK